MLILVLKQNLVMNVTFLFDTLGNFRSIAFAFQYEKLTLAKFLKYKFNSFSKMDRSLCGYLWSQALHGSGRGRFVWLTIIWDKAQLG